MPAKKVKFSSSPGDKAVNVDIPEPLHRAIKFKAVEQGVTMAELLRELLEERYGQ